MIPGAAFSSTLILRHDESVSDGVDSGVMDLIVSSCADMTSYAGSQETRRRLEICLELIGERNERIEELEDSVAEMKAIFRSQLSLAADQLAAAINRIS
jgi:hypothetical protein